MPHFPVFGVTHNLIERRKKSDHKPNKTVFVSLLADKRPWETIQRAPQRAPGGHPAAGLDPLPGLKRRLAVETGQEMFEVRITFVNNIFAQVSGLTVQENFGMNFHLFITKTAFHKKP